MTTTEQALEKVAPQTPAVITTPDEFRGALLRWQEKKFHVLTPFSNISGLAPAHGIFSSLVQISADRTAEEFYDGLPFLKKDHVALAKRGLRKVAEGLGISTRLEYLSVGSVRHYWHVKAIASYRGIDGSTIEREASQEWDLRDGSDRLKGWTSPQLSEARKHGLRACETRAINAAIRECGCGIKQSYHKDELTRPFVTVRVMLQLDMSDPDQKRIALERALGSTNMLYQNASRSLPSVEVLDDDQPAGTAEPRQVGSGSTPAATPPPPPSKPAEPVLPNGFGFLQDVKVVDLKRRDGKGTFPKWIAIDRDGVEHVTIKKDFGEKLDRCFKHKIAVDIDSAENSYQELEIAGVLEFDPAQPSLLPNASEL